MKLLVKTLDLYYCDDLFFALTEALSSIRFVGFPHVEIRELIWP